MAAAGAEEVAAGVFLVRLPLPGPPRTVNVYILRGPDGWALVDTGLDTPESRAALEGAWAAAGVSPAALQVIICTHHHPDHYGASGPLWARTRAPVWIHPAERPGIDHYRTRERPAEARAFFVRHGIPMDRLGHVPTAGEWWGPMYSPAEPEVHLEDGMRLEVAGFPVEVVATPGHTPGHCILRLPREELLIVGDHLLPRITPHVGWYPGGPPDPLGDFLDSQRKVQGLEARAVLPAHGDVYRDHRRRAAQIIRHHEYRLAEIADAVACRPLTAWEAAAHTFGFDAGAPLTLQFPATFETLAHLEHLRFRGAVVRIDDGAETRYRRAGA